jgi:hypothetical protein
MTDQRFVTQQPNPHPIDGVELDAARLATSQATPEGSWDRYPDPGDSHDKGEPGLCVGEAA